MSKYKKKPAKQPAKPKPAPSLKRSFKPIGSRVTREEDFENVNKNTIVGWFGSSNKISSIRSDFDIIRMGSEGITKASIDELARHLGISRKNMAEDIFDLSVKTMERKAPGEKLDKKTSSHALEIARVMQHGLEVFGDEDKVKRWVNKENRSLNNMKPVELFATLTGLNMVNDILGRIEEGVYS